MPPFSISSIHVPIHFSSGSSGQPQVGNLKISSCTSTNPASSYHDFSHGVMVQGFPAIRLMRSSSESHYSF